MTGKTHLLFGVGTGCLVAALSCSGDLGASVGFLAMSALGSIMPDIDNPKALVSKPIKPISRLINKLFGHRGLLHSPLFCLATYLVVRALFYAYSLSALNYLMYGYLFGYLGHLFLDSLTVAGIPLLYPFKKKRFKLLKVRTGGVSEGVAIVIVAICATAAICCYFALPHDFLRVLISKIVQS